MSEINSLVLQGNQNAQELADFVVDILRPTVVILDETSFEELVGGKTEEEMWLVDFYAPWCGPCQQLAPEWRKLAKVREYFVFLDLNSPHGRGWRRTQT